jgi:hypothetical protein
MASTQPAAHKTKSIKTGSDSSRFPVLGNTKLEIHVTLKNGMHDVVLQPITVNDRNTSGL